MIRSPLGLRLAGSDALRDRVIQAASWGVKGLVLEAVGELAPQRMTETGRRDVRNLFRSANIEVIALHLPTRRAYDNYDDLDDRLARAEKAFILAYDLGARLALIRLGAVPAEVEDAKRLVLVHNARLLAERAEHRGVKLGLETGTETGAVFRGFLDQVDHPFLMAGLDPAAHLSHGMDPVETALHLKDRLVHAYAADAATGGRITTVVNPRGLGFAPGVLDWEAYLGALEEINYRGYLTVWPASDDDPAKAFQRVLEWTKRF